MILFVCDATFEGLLTALYFAYKEKKPCRIESGDSIQYPLTGTIVRVDTDYGISGKMEEYISIRCGTECIMTMYKAYLGGRPETPDALLRFFKVAMIRRESTLLMHAHPDVADVLEEKKRVSRESHRMLGFIRFKRIGENLLYAKYSPDSNITPLVAPHFADRMNACRWIIHDVRRDVFAVYNGRDCVVGEYAKAGSLGDLRDMDPDYESLWKAYTKHAAIPGRKNLRLQMSLMPKKYWNFLVETGN